MFRYTSRSIAPVTNNEQSLEESRSLHARNLIFTNLYGYYVEAQSSILTIRSEIHIFVHTLRGQPFASCYLNICHEIGNNSLLLKQFSYVAIFSYIDYFFYTQCTISFVET